MVDGGQGRRLYRGWAGFTQAATELMSSVTQRGAACSASISRWA